MFANIFRLNAKRVLYYSKVCFKSMSTHNFYGVSFFDYRGHISAFYETNCHAKFLAIQSRTTVRLSGDYAHVHSNIASFLERQITSNIDAISQFANSIQVSNNSGMDLQTVSCTK